MSELFASPFFGIALSVLCFWAGVRIQKRTGWWPVIRCSSELC